MNFVVVIHVKSNSLSSMSNAINSNPLTRPRLDFIFLDLRSVLILKNTNQSLNDSLWCSYKYNWCLCFLTFLLNLSEIFNVCARNH